MQTRWIVRWWLWAMALFIFSSHSVGAGPDQLETILAGVEKRYQGVGFSADFKQSSTLKAMQITDTAVGKMTVKRPGKMRWEYQSPERQIIVTDGQSLWIYRPDDNQVTVGKAPTLFGQGKGSGFLANIASIRKQFDITLANSSPAGTHGLKLIPHHDHPDVSAIDIAVEEDSHIIVRIITHNAYGDKNQIDLKNIHFAQALDNDLFEFVIPPGTDIITMDP